MQIQFIGATQTVTGSMHLLFVNGKKILLDCGLFQGRRADTYERNHNFPFNPSEIDAVVLSHAHIDHAGNLPNLVKHGFSRPIFATPATIDLCKIMLMDSAYIQKRDAEFVSKKNAKKHLPRVEPLYSVEDIQPVIDLFREVPYRTDQELLPGVQLQFFDAGHILGSASIRLSVSENHHTTTFGFTGDLGRPNLPILRDPDFLGNVDALISESTYGGRFHDTGVKMEEKFLDVIRRTVDRGGKIVVPAFSVGRTQDIVYMLNDLFNRHLLPNIPVFVDSPLSFNATEVFRKHRECFDDETIELMKTDPDPFGFDRLTYIKDVEESKKLNDLKTPCMIIASSGMCEAGRIVHHLANSIGNPKNTVLIVGYQAEHTVGWKLVNRTPIIRLFGEEHELKSDVVVMNSFSAHADRNELLAYFDHFNRQRLKNIFLVHGDPDQCEKFSYGLKERNFRRVDIPVRLQKFDV